MKSLLVLLGMVLSFSVQAKSSNKHGLTDLECLAGAIYLEARGEPIQGQLAVAKVVHNRTVTRIKSICGVLTEPKQFSNFSIQKVAQLKRANSDDWKHALLVAQLSGVHKKDPTKGATYFQLKTIPHSKTHYIVVAEIGDHKFMRPKKQAWE